MESTAMGAAAVIYRFNHILTKWMPLITMCSVVTGVILASWLHTLTGWVPWIFAFMTFIGSLGSTFGDLRKVILHPMPVIVCMGILHVAMPLIAWGISGAVFKGDPHTITGIVLEFVIPTGIKSLIWVTFSQGHTTLTLSIILIDTLLSPLIVPFSLQFLLGAEVDINTWAMLRGLLWMIVIPSCLGMLLQQFTKGKAYRMIGVPFAPLTKLLLAIVIAINSSIAAPYLVTMTGKAAGIALLLLGLAAIGYVLGYLSARLFGWDQSVVVALTYNSGMRNISAGAVLAMTYFPPQVTLPVVIIMLFQQLLASLYSIFLRNFQTNAKQIQT